MLLRARTIAAATSILLLAACGSMHPGAAATVDDTTITMKDADAMAVIYCELGLLNAQEQGATSISNADARRQALADMVRLSAARQVAEDENLVPSPSSYELGASQRAEIAENYPGDDEGVLRAIETNQELSAIAQALGEAAAGVEVTAENQEQVLTAGMQVIDEAMAGMDIDIDPRFGLGDDLTQATSTGSLSVPDADLVLPGNDDLPETQRCA